MKSITLEGKLKEKGRDNLAVVAFIFKGDKILIGLRNYSEEKKVWTAPGGRCDEGETVEETLKREVEEEVGINDLKIEKFLG